VRLSGVGTHSRIFYQTHADGGIPTSSPRRLRLRRALQSCGQQEGEEEKDDEEEGSGMMAGTASCRLPKELAETGVISPPVGDRGQTLFLEPEYAATLPMSQALIGGHVRMFAVLNRRASMLRRGVEVRGAVPELKN
jgi:hypothetical protein